MVNSTWTALIWHFTSKPKCFTIGLTFTHQWGQKNASQSETLKEMVLIPGPISTATTPPRSLHCYLRSYRYMLPFVDSRRTVYSSEERVRMTFSRVHNTKKPTATISKQFAWGSQAPRGSRFPADCTRRRPFCCAALNEAGSAARAALLFVSDGKTLAEKEPGVWRAAGEISLSVTALSKEKWHITSPR